MARTLDFSSYLNRENEAERLSALESLLSDEAACERDLLVWKVLSSFPSKFELARLATSTRVSKRSDGSWALVSYLLQEADQDVVGNAINSLTFSSNRALGHRLMKFFETKERPQRILYCLARFAEETVDRRYSNILSSFMESDLSDAFLARSFNALFRLGVKDRLAIKVAMDLVSSHIDATNMDRKAAVSAIVYLCFAGDAEDLEQIKSVQNKVTIPELRRLLNWGLYELNGFEQLNFDSEAAKNFLKRATNLSEPNFTGYGCFSDENLKAGAQAFLKEIQPVQFVAATRTLLALGHGAIIDLLAKDKRIGLKAIAEQNLGELKMLWRHYLPTHSKEFMRNVKDPALFDVWHDRSPELVHVILDRTDFLKRQKDKENWQDVFTRLVKNGDERAADLVSAQLLVLEREPPADTQDPLVDQIVKNIELLRARTNTNKDKETLAALVYGIVFCGTFPLQFVQKIYECVPFPRLSWTFNAFSLKAPKLSPDDAEVHLKRELALIESALSSADLEFTVFRDWVGAQYQGILHVISRMGVQISASVLQTVDELATRVQAVFDAVESADEPNPEDEVHAEDWGHAIKDRPVLRWNAVLQVWVQNELPDAARDRYDLILRDALRVAPHVEKRWIVCALVKLGSDDAIKAILYQAIQHVDQEFVAHTIRQLLRSNHPRAQQALIRCVARNTISDDLKFTILDELSLDNPQEVLHELKTLEILRLPPHIDDAIRDAVGRLAELVDTTSESEQRAGTKKVKSLASTDVDGIIRGFLPEADVLSVDSRSALRTAEMILIQSKEWGEEAVDLSPIVNMHCKAVELTLRETFEGYTDAVIRRGDLSRKLDILGYARPIPEKMQIFEDYLAQLQVIRTIPYFSKFKLRKMLRAVCLYRPGKRFTLDGPKAFALLFLVGSRRECPFGLAGTVPLGFASDHELFEFIKLVHSLQDSRNRAVHEGLTWEAQDEIESMRSQAYRIIHECIALSKELKARHRSGGEGFVGVGA